MSFGSWSVEQPLLPCSSWCRTFQKQGLLNGPVQAPCSDQATLSPLRPGKNFCTFLGCWLLTAAWASGKGGLEELLWLGFQAPGKAPAFAKKLSHFFQMLPCPRRLMSHFKDSFPG